MAKDTMWCHEDGNAVPEIPKLNVYKAARLNPLSKSVRNRKEQDNVGFDSHSDT